MSTTQRNIAITIMRDRSESRTTLATMIGIILVTLSIIISTIIIMSMFVNSKECTEFRSINIWAWFYTTYSFIKCLNIIILYYKPHSTEYVNIKYIFNKILFSMFIGCIILSILSMYSSIDFTQQCKNEPLYKLAFAYFWLFITGNILIPVFAGIILICIFIISYCCSPRLLVQVAEHVGPTNNGASDEILQSLDNQKYNPYTTRIHDITCTICTEDYTNDVPIILLPCGDGKHHYHKKCIEQWLRINSTCPQCRTQITLQPQPE